MTPNVAFDKNRFKKSNLNFSHLCAPFCYTVMSSKPHRCQSLCLGRENNKIKKSQCTYKVAHRYEMTVASYDFFFNQVVTFLCQWDQVDVCWLTIFIRKVNI